MMRYGNSNARDCLYITWLFQGSIRISFSLETTLIKGSTDKLKEGKSFKAFKHKDRNSGSPWATHDWIYTGESISACLASSFLFPSTFTVVHFLRQDTGLDGCAEWSLLHTTVNKDFFFFLTPAHKQFTLRAESFGLILLFHSLLLPLLPLPF